ncbi:MAG: hypothetical protein QM737_06590 [Ferruginibacter sp.]
MMQKNEMIYNELKELNSPLADISNRNVFTVPDGYFDALAAGILHGIHNQSAIDELEIPPLDLKVPVGYFEGLADTIMSKIKKEEADSSLENEYPSLLEPVRHMNVFKVPAGYFENLAENILVKVPVQAKVITMKQRPSVFKYAIAACISGMIGLSLFSLFDQKNGIEKPASGSSELILVNIFDKANEIIKNDSFDKMMESLGDDEIEGYLKNDGEDINAALVASLTDEKTLPSEDDYFTDDKALENFLTEQNIVQSNKN